MASQCPKCHQFVEEDYVCCADVEFQWKCQECHKRSRGFAVPFGRCSLCGGELVMIKEVGLPPKKQTLVLQEAFQIEISAHHFYNRLAEAVDDPQVSDFFQSMAEMEKGHAEELEQKYHLHLTDTGIYQKKEWPLPKPFFEEISCFANTGDLKRLFDCAIRFEKETLDYFSGKAREISRGKERELYLELAAEEQEHIVLLETERDRMEVKP